MTAIRSSSQSHIRRAQRFIHQLETDSATLQIQPLKKLYEARMIDLGNKSNLKLYRSFQKFIFSKCKNRKLYLAGLQLGINSVKMIVSIIRTGAQRYGRLILDNNQIGDQGLKLLASVLPVAQLSQISLANNKVTFKGIRTLLNEQIKGKTLFSLNLSNYGPANKNWIDQRACLQIYKYLSLAPTIGILSLENCSINDVAFQSLLRGSEKSKNLKSLNLRKNFITGRINSNEIIILLQLQLDVLDLSYNQLSNYIFQKIYDFKRLNPELKLRINKLYLQKQKFDEKGVSRLIESFKYNKFVQNLDLDKNDLVGIMLEQPFLGCQVKKLSLQSCCLTPLSIISLTSGLINSSSCRLRYLSLYDNRLSQEASSVLSNLIQSKFDCLQQLNLGKCLLKDDSGLVLFKGLRNHTLKNFILNSNFLTDCCADLIISALKLNRNIIVLNLQTNQLSLISYRKIWTELQLNNKQWKFNSQQQLQKELSIAKRSFGQNRVAFKLQQTLQKKQVLFNQIKFLETKIQRIKKRGTQRLIRLHRLEDEEKNVFSLGKSLSRSLHKLHYQNKNNHF